MNTKRVLITGARGLIGQHCLAPLASLGYEVHAVSSRSVAAPGDVVWHTADLLSADSTRALIANVRPTHALHLAWMATPGIYTTALDNLRWAAAGPALMTALIEHGAQRIVAVGTCAEYDWTQGPCDERTTPLVPTTLYSAAKHAWRMAYETMARGAVDTAWARIFFLFGPGEHPKRVVPSIIQPLLRGEVAQLSAGTQVRDFLYVKDVSGALVALLDSQVTGSVNIGSGQAMTIRELATVIGDQIGRPDLLRFGQPAAEPPHLLAATHRLFSEVGWHPKYDLLSGVNETISWWKSRP